MKRAKPTAKRPRRPAAAAHKAVHRKRPLHKKVLLHPFSVMVLLCVGVFIIGAAFQGRAATYDVTATVPAQPLTAPAVIAEPADQLHVTTTPITVSGTCPANSYVKLYRNDAFSGVALCAGGLFQVQADLAGGPNTLDARAFNLTDEEGPDSPAITVYYDETTLVPDPPASVPTTLRVADLDSRDYQPGAVQQTSVIPTISGMAPPFSDVVVTVHSEVQICKTKANATGWWACTLERVLPAGVHQVDIVATTPDGRQLVFPTFKINARLDLSDLTRFSKPLLINADYNYQAARTKQIFNFNLALGGGVAPYEVHVDWGDGKTSDITRTEDTTFTITHTYDEPNEYVVLVTVTDAKGIVSRMQLLAVTTDPSITGAAAVGSDSMLSNLATNLKEWLWVIAPIYIVIILMVFSYWIGEQQVYWRLMAGRSAGHKGKGR
jgi:hypothetical protein